MLPAVSNRGGGVLVTMVRGGRKNFDPIYSSDREFLLANRLVQRDLEIMSTTCSALS